MPRVDLTPYDITTPKPHPEKGTAWTVPGTDVELVSEYVQRRGLSGADRRIW